MGDEELEEGLPPRQRESIGSDDNVGDRRGRAIDRVGSDERRLSVELERGFKDESSDSEEERGRTRLGRR